MNTPIEQERDTVELSREEQWTVHHVILDRIEREAEDPAATDPPALDVYRIFEKLEAGTHRFTRSERRRLEAALEASVEATATPNRDRRVAERVLDKLGNPMRPE